MARKLRLLFEGGIYHVTFRGNARQDIFVDTVDRLRMLERLSESVETFGVRLHAYCLMGNHVHLLVETPLGNLDRFMGSLLTGYTVYYNRKHRRVGHLMQGRYGAQVVEGDRYLLRLSRYIHLNPVKVKNWVDRPLAERRTHVRGYRWSSYQAYVGRTEPLDGLVRQPLWDLVGSGRSTAQAYRRFVEEGLVRSDDELASLRKESPLAIGSSAFVESLKREYERTAAAVQREDVSFRALKVRHSAAAIRSAVLRVCGDDEGILVRRKSGAAARHLWAWALQKYGGLSQREIAVQLDVGTGAAVSYMLRRQFPGVEKLKPRLDLIFKG